MEVPDPDAALREGIDLLSTGEPDDVETAIARFEAASSGFEEGALKWATAQLNLGVALAQRPRGSQEENVERALAHLASGLAIVGPQYQPDHTHGLMELGSAFLRRVAGDLGENLEQARELLTAASNGFRKLNAKTEEAMARSNLGRAYALRLRGDRSENLEMALESYRAALPGFVAESDAGWRADVLLNSAAAHLERRVGRWQDNVEHAIDQLTRAERAICSHRMPVRRAAIAINLGFAYLRRGEGDRAWNLEQAVRNFRCAQEWLGDESVHEFANACAGLGDALASLAEMRGDQALWDQALGHYDRAAVLLREQEELRAWAAVQNSIGQTLARRNPDDDRTRDAALGAFRRALAVYDNVHDLIERRRTLANVAALHFARRQWSEALAAYIDAIAAGEAALGAAYTGQGRREAAGSMSALFAHAAYCALRLGDHDRALELLDRGKARTLGEALVVSGAVGHRWPGRLGARLQDAATAVESLQAQTDPKRTAALSAAWDDLQQFMAEARDAGLIPGGVSAKHLADLIPGGSALVACIVTTAGSAAIVVPERAMGTPITCVDLPDLTEDVVDGWLHGRGSEPGWVDAYRATRPYGDTAAHGRWADVVNRVTEHLWRALLGPVDAVLRELGLEEGGRVLLAAPGKLSVLPLHAAWRQTESGPRPFCADWTASYFPGGVPQEAVHARRAARQPFGSALLAISDPTENLMFAGLEVDRLEEHFTPAARRVLRAGDATEEAVVGAAPACTHAHFACHGIFDWSDPMATALQLAGGELLTVADVMTMVQLRRADLAVLSACETGLIDLDGAPEEHVGFSTAFLDAGATVVVSTLWAVDDASTAVTMTKFYELLMHHRRSPAAALREASEWVRTSTAAELDLPRWYDAAYRRNGNPLALEQAREHRAYPDRKPYAGPRHWAAFVITGASD